MQLGILLLPICNETRHSDNARCAAAADDGFAVIQDYTIGQDVVEIEMDGSWTNVGDGLMYTDDSGDQLKLFLALMMLNK